MNLIDATWDTRNLGLPCLETVFGASDTASDVLRAEERARCYGFVTAKVPAGNFEVLLALQKEGYSFVESLFSLEHRLASFEYPRIPGRFEPFMSYESLSPEDYCLVFDEIDKGLFSTDRIALDSHFTAEAAALRYKNWIIDESHRNLDLLQVSYKDTPVGFIACTARGTVLYPFLASLYKDSLQSGLGPNLVIESIKYAQQHEYKRIETAVSSNNYPVVKIHEMLGYSLKGIEYVLTCHRDIQ